MAQELQELVQLQQAELLRLQQQQQQLASPHVAAYSAMRDGGLSMPTATEQQLQLEAGANAELRQQLQAATTRLHAAETALAAQQQSQQQQGSGALRLGPLASYEHERALFALEDATKAAAAAQQDAARCVRAGVWVCMPERPFWGLVVAAAAGNVPALPHLPSHTRTHSGTHPPTGPHHLLHIYCDSPPTHTHTHHHGHVLVSPQAAPCAA